MGPEARFWGRIKRLLQKGYMQGEWERVEVKLPAGFPDCVAILAGRTVLVELKSVEKESDLRTELRPFQASFIDRWNRAGGEAYVLAWIENEGRMRWYRNARAIREGKPVRVLAPFGAYVPGHEMPN